MGTSRREIRRDTTLGLTLAATSALALGAIFVTADLASAEDDFRYLVQLQGRTFIPEAGDLSAGLEYLQSRSDRGVAHVLVQLDEIPTADERVALGERGLVLQGYLPEHTYYAIASTDLNGAELQGMGVRWMSPLADDLKVSPRIREGRYEENSDLGDSRRAFVVQFHRDVTREQAEASAVAAGGDFGDWIPSLSTLMVGLDPAELDALSSRDEVKYVAHVPPMLTGVNNSARTAMEVDPLHTAPYNLTGNGSNVLVYDVGPADRNHPDLNPRVTYGESGSAATHSTHVAGTVAGDGSSSGGTYKGMAPGAKITSYYYESCTPNCLYNSPQDIAENYEEGWLTYGAQFSTNSLGANIPTNGYDCAWTGDYELTSQLLDAIAVGQVFGTNYLSLWAAGNDRQSSRCGSTYSTMGVPANAKNPIIVGATNSNDHSITWFTSWGPSDDGRLRPDVTGPGCQTNDDGGITSTRPGSGYTTMCGTSMATPAVAGVVALLREQGRRTIGFPVQPLPSLIKALLVNNCDDRGNPGPDYQFGHGEVNAKASIDHLRSAFFYSQGNASQDEAKTFDIQVEGLSKLKATLAWDDVPGELLAAKELINDLELTLESPSGQIHTAWVLNPANPSGNATRGANHRDNVELVEVDNPEDGVWTIHVDGYLVPEGPQSFSVVANARKAQNTADVEDAIGNAPSGLDEVASYPNPFLPQTTIRFRLDESSPVSVDIFDASGRVVRNLISGESRGAGMHFVTWDGSDNLGDRLPGGVYFYQVRAGDDSQARKVLMLD